MSVFEKHVVVTVLAKGTSQSISVVFLKSVLALFLLTRSLNDKCRIATDILVKIISKFIVSKKWIGLKFSRLCLTINNDRIWLLWNKGGNSFKIHAGFFKIFDYHTSGRFKPSAKLMIRQILSVRVILVDFLGCK